MRFDVHKAIVCQSPFFYRLLKNLDSIPHLDKEVTMASGDAVTTLTIDLVQALLHRKFVLAPFQHIVRRKWQKPGNAPGSQTCHLLASHIRFTIQWLYLHDTSDMIKNMKDEDTLRILLVAILFDLDDLAQMCVERYISDQLSIKTITRDLEYICQLPRSHPTYLQLREAALLLLFRHGPEDAVSLASLPVDYMADVLSADLLFVENEYERYCLLRKVLVCFMQSVGKITWTHSGPVDQENKRLSGFVRPLSKMQSVKEKPESLTAETVRSRKRKRIPSQELIDADTSPYERSRPKLSRISFSSCVPFEKLIADASSGGVIDKATVLSYLLRTTVNYSNMTFDQLTTVRNDGIVDEGTVFRALWQREALERIIFPFNFRQSQLVKDNEDEKVESHHERSIALNEYFDVDNSESQERRRRILLGMPRFRFRVSMVVTQPSIENGWLPEESYSIHTEDSEFLDTSSEISACPSNATNEEASQVLMNTFYSRAETVLGTVYRVQARIQAMPSHLLYIQDKEEKIENEKREDTDSKQVLVCRFELQRETCLTTEEDNVSNEANPHYPPHEGNGNSNGKSEAATKMTKIRYSIFCLNRHKSLSEGDRVDPEDRILLPATEQTEKEQSESSSGYVDEVVMDASGEGDVVIDAMVALEVFKFEKV
ncbi:hypothetical protein EC973_002571 [Apophysomyces ossiformis]|uniref:BTB domain-containing protein n=1 Tax=Apophysomyces ossiformis TaxID=679940 RepID=A0A8H7ELM9_9FUNG|nr:hypothetical protein EC973_002571 [Apophysomyces ossiformis]